MNAELQKLVDEAKRIVANPALNDTQKSRHLDAVEKKIGVITARKNLSDYRFLAESGSGSGIEGLVPQLNGFGAAPGGAPRYSVDETTTKTLFDAANARTSIAVKASTETTGQIAPATVPHQFLPPLTAAREPMRVADLLPSTAVETGIINYYRTAGTAAAGPTAEATLKPQSDISYSRVVAGMTKLAHRVNVSEEALSDFPTFANLLQMDMEAGLIDAENRELISATGVAPSAFPGLLATSGILTRTQAVAPETALDTLELAVTDLRNSGRFVSPDAIVMNPTDYSAVRRIKDSQLRYLAGSPLEVGPSTLWGIPVVKTSQIPAKTVLIANFAASCMLWVREGISIRMDPYSQMSSNVVQVIVEERIALGVIAPAALIKVTLT